MTHKSHSFLTKIKLFVLISTSLVITSMSNVCFSLASEQSTAETAEPGKSKEGAKTEEADKSKEAEKTVELEKPKEVVVQMCDNFFYPRSIIVAAGQRVIWVNRGRQAHNVSIRGYFNSGCIPPGGSTSYVFKNDGFYSAICTEHSFMFAGMINRIKVN